MSGSEKIKKQGGENHVRKFYIFKPNKNLFWGISSLEPPGDGIFHLQSHHNMLCRHIFDFTINLLIVISGFQLLCIRDI